jgi:hypothetical protein
MTHKIPIIEKLIKKCIYEENTNSKIKLFFKINSLLPKELKIRTHYL